MKILTNEDTNEPQIINDNDGYEHYRFSVAPGQETVRIDKYLTNLIQNTSRNKLRLAADSCRILVNNGPVKSNYKVKPYDEITIVMPYPLSNLEIILEDIPLNIVYEDDSFIIVNKKPGMVVHPSYGHYSGTLVNALAYHFKDKNDFNADDPRLGLVHRIDKDTSGILVIAKTERAKNIISQQFADKTSNRTYIAVVWGDLKNDTGSIIANVGRNLKDRKIMHAFPNGEYGKYAVTHYKVIERLGYVNVVQCKLETGRTHQIRVHFQHIGHPLFADAVYGGDQILKGTTFIKYKQFVTNCFKICPRQALHAKTLGFMHPETGVQVTFNSDLPSDIELLIKKWRTYIHNRNIN